LDLHRLGPADDSDVVGTFEKSSTGGHGDVIARLAPDITPDDPQITGAIEKQLGKA
jgi:glutathione peroxidase